MTIVRIHLCIKSKPSIRRPHIKIHFATSSKGYLRTASACCTILFIFDHANVLVLVSYGISLWIHQTQYTYASRTLLHMFDSRLYVCARVHVYVWIVFVCLNVSLSLCVCSVYTISFGRVEYTECRSSVFVFILQASQRKVILGTKQSQIDTVRYLQHMCRVYWIHFLLLLLLFLHNDNDDDDHNDDNNINGTLLHQFHLCMLFHFT